MAAFKIPMVPTIVGFDLIGQAKLRADGVPVTHASAKTMAKAG